MLTLGPPSTDCYHCATEAILISFDVTILPIDPGLSFISWDLDFWRELAVWGFQTMTNQRLFGNSTLLVNG